jgi:glutamate racemase
MISQLPIGVFDSGLGGLSVLSTLVEGLPNEPFIYLGDVARLPYGTKSPSVVKRYVRTCVSFMEAQGVKMIVIACNTATATALESVRQQCQVPIFGVIEPGVRAAVNATRSKRVLVLATEATVRSESYLREFQRQASEVSVEQLACPLLVPLAEEGWFDHEITASVLTHYLRRAQDPEYDTLLFGCTHYPLLERSFRRVVGEKCALIHSAHLLTQEIKTLLDERGWANPGDRGSKGLRFCSTDALPRAVPIVSSLFGDRASFEIVDL